MLFRLSLDITYPFSSGALATWALAGGAQGVGNDLRVVSADPGQVSLQAREPPAMLQKQAQPSDDVVALSLDVPACQGNSCEQGLPPSEPKKKRRSRLQELQEVCTLLQALLNVISGSVWCDLTSAPANNQTALHDPEVLVCLDSLKIQKQDVCLGMPI